MINKLDGVIPHGGAGLAAGVILAAAFGALNGYLMPRGPVTTAQALATMIAAFAVGLLGGVSLRSRWALLAIPFVFVLAVELVRLGYVGPTVDGVRLNSMYGVIAFISGRGVHGVVALSPMVLGVLYGIGPVISGHLTAAEKITLGASTLAVLLLMTLIAMPAGTPPIQGPDGEEHPDAVSALETVEIGGKRQALLIRGVDADNPVLLYLAGGPGGTDLGAMRLFGSKLEERFVVVTWDQRGAGKSYSALDPVNTLTLEQAVNDTVELTNYLRDRFDEDKIVIIGNSWGTIPGVLAVQRRPQLYYAYVGAGQMVSPRETDIMFYEDTLTYAQQTGDDALYDRLVRNGPPPYDNLWELEPALSHEHDWNSYPSFNPGVEMPAILMVSEYTFLEKLHAFGAFLDTFSALYPQIQDVDLREDVTSLDVPVYMVLGRHEARGRALLAEEWFEQLEAPHKEKHVFEGSGHRPHFEEPDRFALVMAQILGGINGSN
jgi:pimeloyl-ACP methyl ester carboxylesterase